ncbi:MAG TPA: 30S ribosomal protein S12 methylthiotransferase RimO [Bacteroidota bacterium]|nr:30S ribosomal protein S12 methylthiotransferase RimO [Bacteroidota bacterium]
MVTLGCSKNTVDSEELMRQLGANDWTITDDGEAGVALINTCGFIEEAKRESIETILAAVAKKKAGEFGKVVVMGCLSERYASELMAGIPEIDHIVGANRIDEVVRTLGGESKHELLGERRLTTPSHFAYLKISEGCDRPCSFCAIPLMRGKHVSKPIERVVLEARRLASLGVRELVLIAQDSTCYGLDLYGKRVIARLLRELSAVEGIEWIRVMYAFPSGFPEDLLEEIAVNPRVCKYIDMPVQHVSDAVLSSMRRGIGTEGLRSLISRIRSAVPTIALRTTLIVGYPNETASEFGELLDFVRDSRFDRLGVFEYSPEDDTAAFGLGDPVPRAEKLSRRMEIMEAQKAVSLGRNEAMIGTGTTILIDRADEGAFVGRTEHDAPEVDNEVFLTDAPGAAVGHFSRVRIVDAVEYDLFAVLSDQADQTDRAGHNGPDEGRRTNEPPGNRQ